MVKRAIEIVKDYTRERFGIDYDFKVYIVWQVKALQNWKFLISTNLNDGMYYELTYNGHREEWYLDAYKKVENRVIY